MIRERTRPRSRENAGGRDRRSFWLTAAIVTALWLVWGLFNATRLRLIVPDFTWRQALLYGVPDGLWWAVLTPIPVLLARRFPLPSPTPWRNVTVHLVAGSAVAVLHSQLDAALNSLREWMVTGDPIFGHLSAKLLTYAFHTNLVVYLGIAGIAMYLARLESLRQRERQAAELRAQLTEARLAALQAQIRPHFLFNALHTVGALTESDPVTGRRVLRQLGELLRASLSAEGEQLIPLRREVELSRAYLDIQAARFGDRLEVSTEIDERALEASFPALLLQPLIENAIRHGIGRSATPGYVKIEATRRDERLVVVVRNSLPAAAPEDGGTGIGLASVRERLRALYADDQRLEIGLGDDFAVSVEIPYSKAPPLTGPEPVNEPPAVQGRVLTDRRAS